MIGDHGYAIDCEIDWANENDFCDELPKHKVREVCDDKERKKRRTGANVIGSGSAMTNASD